MRDRQHLDSNSCQTEPNDFDDEDDVGLTLTLPDSETDLFVPEPDEVQTDEDEYYEVDSPEVWRVMKVVPWMSDDYHQDVAQQPPLLTGETVERPSKSKTSIGRNEAGTSQNSGTEAQVQSSSTQFTSRKPVKGNRTHALWCFAQCGFCLGGTLFLKH